MFATDALLSKVVYEMGATVEQLALLRTSALYAQSVAGTVQLVPASLFCVTSVPYVVLHRLQPIADQIRLLICRTKMFEGRSLQHVGNEVQASYVLFKHNVIQFMRCYACVIKFCPKLYLAPVFEWIIAQVKREMFEKFLVLLFTLFLLSFISSLN